MLLYIHIPFCENKCPYCAFGSVTGKQNLISDYFHSIIVDLRTQIKKFNVAQGEIESVFIGGGTPSAVSAEFYEPLFKELAPFLTSNCEITSEANPNSADLTWLKFMRSLGVNRMSFGAQSFFEDKLKFLGRSHDSRQVYEAVQNAKIAGFKNINVDLICGTKFDTKKRLLTEAQNIKNLDISHVSAYSLTLEKNTPFYKKTSYQKDSPRLAKFLINELENIGLKQYEISNFGQICRHNLGYWQGKNYLAVGAYAVGFMKNVRFYGSANLSEYIKNPISKQTEFLSKDELQTERIFLGARSIVGIDALDLTPLQLQKAEILRKTRKLNFKNGRYQVKNFLLADEISLFIIG